MTTSNIQLAIACERLRMAIARNTTTNRQEAVAKKWAIMALESSQKKAMRMARGK